MEPASGAGDACEDADIRRQKKKNGAAENSGMHPAEEKEFHENGGEGGKKRPLGRCRMQGRGTGNRRSKKSEEKGGERDRTEGKAPGKNVGEGEGGAEGSEQRG